MKLCATVKFALFNTVEGGFNINGKEFCEINRKNRARELENNKLQGVTTTVG